MLSNIRPTDKVQRSWDCYFREILLIRFKVFFKEHTRTKYIMQMGGRNVGRRSSCDCLTVGKLTVYPTLAGFFSY